MQTIRMQRQGKWIIRQKGWGFRGSKADFSKRPDLAACPQKNPETIPNGFEVPGNYIFNRPRASAIPYFHRIKSRNYQSYTRKTLRQVRNTTSERFDHHQNDNRDHQQSRNFIDEAIMTMAACVPVGRKHLHAAREIPVISAHDQDQRQLGVKPAVAKKNRPQKRPTTRTPRLRSSPAS